MANSLMVCVPPAWGATSPGRRNVFLVLDTQRPRPAGRGDRERTPHPRNLRVAVESNAEAAGPLRVEPLLAHGEKQRPFEQDLALKTGPPAVHDEEVQRVAILPALQRDHVQRVDDDPVARPQDPAPLGAAG